MARKALVIGLGTTGSVVCNQLIERLEWENGGIHRTPWIRFVAVETAGVQGMPVERTLNAVSIPVENNTGLLSVLEHPVRWEQQIAPRDWTDPALSEAVQRIGGAGAGNLRQVGRLAMLYPAHYGRVIGAIHDRLEELVRLTPQKAQEDYEGRESDPLYPPRRRTPYDPPFALEDRIDIYVVGTLCGGTSSGSFVDMPYMIEADNAYRPDLMKVVGIMAGYPTNGTTAEYGANTFAALREYHHWSTEGMTFSARYDGHDIRTRRKPYHEFHLISPASEAREDIDRMCSAAADYLYIRTFSPDASRVDARRADYGNGYNTPAPNGQEQHFATFGVSGIEYPARRFVEACQLQLIRNALFGFQTGQPLQPEQLANLSRSVQQELVTLGLLGEGLLSRLLAGGGGKTVLDQMLDHIHDRATNSGGNLDELDACDIQMEIALGTATPGAVSVAPTLPAGCVPSLVGGNTERLRTELRVALSRKLRETMLNPDGGLIACRNWVTAAKDLVSAEMARYKPDASGSTPVQKEREAEKDGKDRLLDELDAVQRDPFLLLTFGKPWAVPRLTAEWTQAAQRYYELRVTEMQQSALLDILSLIADDLARYQERLAEEAYLPRYARAALGITEKELDDALRRPHLSNYEVLTPVTPENVQAEYRSAFSEPNDRQDAWIERERQAKRNVLGSWENLAAAVFATPETPQEIQNLLPGVGRPLTDSNLVLSADHRKTLRDRSRVFFERIEHRHILARLKELGENDARRLVGAMLQKSKPMLRLNLADRTRFENLPKKKAGFLFYNGQATAASPAPPAEVQLFSRLTEAEARGAEDETGEIQASESVEQHRVTVIREQTAFALGVVEGFQPGGSYHQYWERKPPRATYYSRSDIRFWYPIEPDPNADEIVRLFLVLVAIGKIDPTQAKLLLRVPQQVDPVEFPRNIKQIRIQFSSERPGSEPGAESGADAIKSAIRLEMQNLVFAYRRDPNKGVDQLVLDLHAFIQHAGQAGLEQSEGLPLDPATARDWLLPYLMQDQDLWSRWIAIPGNAPGAVDPEMLYRHAGDAIHCGKAQADGYYCDKCGFRFGPDAADVRQAKRCVRCQKAFVLG